jgi:3D (Asp-Asp-Asp) domain-containing protein
VFKYFIITHILTFLFLACGVEDKKSPQEVPPHEFSLIIGDEEPQIPEEDYFETKKITTPLVKILSPSTEDIVESPTIVTVSAYNIHNYKLFSNGEIVASETAPLEHRDIFCNLNKMGFPHTLELFGYDREGNEIAYDSIRVTPLPPINLSKGDLVGNLWISYYYLSREIEYFGKRDILLRDSKCTPMAMVSYDFSSSVCIEGSGKLMDHSVINYSSSCRCGIPCPLGGIICYDELDNKKFPWGQGSRNNTLIPFRSLAVDNNVIPPGTVIYLEEWDGVYIPPEDGIGNFIHDGCFRADDVGGYVKNDHFDFFSGTRSMWFILEKIAPTRTQFTLYMNSGRCEWLKNIKTPTLATSGIIKQSTPKK